MKSMSKIYACYRSGEPLSDNEIIDGIRHFRQLADLLKISGESFRLTLNECWRVIDVLEGYRRARGIP